MKDKKHRHCCLWPVIALILVASVRAVDKRDVIDYYWRNATRAYAAHDPVRAGQTLAFTATASVNQLSRGAKVRHTDTTVNRYYYSGNQLDSVVFVLGKKPPLFPVDVVVLNIFDSTYVRTLFPNDRGEGELAIGFDTDSLADPRPAGIVTIDRNQYTMRRLHVVYHGKPGFVRFSRSFHFVSVGEWVVADSIVETGALRGFLVNEDYQIAISISDISIEDRSIPGAGK